VSGRKRVFFEVARDAEGVEEAVSGFFFAKHCQTTKILQRQ